ncbi:MAG: ABC transporter substrate-binding protein [Desulfuromonadales bacterium]|nr:ABC transporter substrate-binding protein [Desulfuromonadales bacterium]
MSINIPICTGMSPGIWLRLSLISILHLAVLLTAASAQNREVPSPPSQDYSLSELRIGLNATDVETLDPHLAAAFNDRLVVDMVFNGLLRYEPGNAPRFEADLAEMIPEPYLKGGRQVWPVRLKKGITFHPTDGHENYELTADDIVFSFRRAADPDRSRYAGEYVGMTVEKVDRYSCNIIMEPPLSPVLFYSKIADYAGGLIVPKKVLEESGEENFRRQPIGTGPFRFVAYQSKHSVSLAANDRYFRGPPHLDVVNIFFYPDATERYREFKRGNLDLIRGGDEVSREKFLPKETIVDVFGVPEVAIIYFNTMVKPLDDIRVRKAIAYALDRERFLAPFDSRTATNVYSVVPETYLPGGVNEEQVKSLGLDYAYNPDKARALLAEAGYPDGFSLEIIATRLKHVQKNYLTLKEQLREVGIHLKLHVVDHATMHRLIRQDLSPIVIYEAWRPNTDVFLSRFFHSDSIVVTGKNPDTNFSHYQGIDDLIVRARQEMDPEWQTKLWEYAQVKILEDMVAYPLHYRKRVYIRRGDLDYGHLLHSSMALYPQVTEKTRILK